jgi:phage gpG-like protein
MNDVGDFLNNILDDVQVDLTQEFDRNFERQAFFDRKWPSARHANSRGSALQRTGALRKSIGSKRGSSGISWTSPLPYATIHNEGGQIEVTKKMKSFFWAMFYKTHGAITKGKSKRNERMTGEAAKFKAMALLKVGTMLDIQQSQFIGWHPEVDRHIEVIVKHNVEDLNELIKTKLKP